MDTEFNDLIFSKDDGVLLFSKVSGQAGPRKDLEEGGGGGRLVADTVDSPSDCVIIILVPGKIKVDNVVGWPEPPGAPALLSSCKLCSSSLVPEGEPGEPAGSALGAPS
jgi:hypothetical protein